MIFIPLLALRDHPSFCAFGQEPCPARPLVKRAESRFPTSHSLHSPPGQIGPSDPVIEPYGLGVPAPHKSVSSPLQLVVNIASQLVYRMPRKPQRQHLDVHLGSCQPLPTTAVQTQGQGLVTSPTQSWWHVFGKHI